MKLTIKKSTLVLILILGLTSIISIFISNYWVNAVGAIIVFVVIVLYVNNRSPIQLMFLIGFAAFIFSPAIINGYLYNTNFHLYFATSVVSFYFLSLTRNLQFQAIRSTFFEAKILLICSTVGMLVVSYIGSGSLFVISPFVMAYTMALRPNKWGYNIALTIWFVVIFSIYIIWGWSGFGRTITISIAATGALYLCYVQGINIPKTLVAILGSVGSLLFSVRKSIGLDLDLYELSEDSAISPYRLASSFYNDYLTFGQDFSGFLDQVVFTFTSFVPREWWSNKPYGFGFQYVVDNMDLYLIDSGHSIASTLIGDHIYYLGWVGIITGLLIIWIISIATKMCYNSKWLHGYADVIIIANMPVLVWGGMTSFSARIAYGFIFLLPFASLYIIRNYKMMIKI